jgi:glycine betaine/proline transport system substrate-binding protein
MGDPSYVTYDEQIIKNLELPLKYVVAGSEAALITAIEQAETDQKPLLLQFWQPHWLQSKVKLTQVELPEVTDECLASAAAADGGYACDYPVDELYKAANAGLEAKNKAAFDFLSKFQLTTDQQNEIAAMVDSDGKTADAAAEEWVDANPDVVAFPGSADRSLTWRGRKSTFSGGRGALPRIRSAAFSAIIITGA